MATLKITSNSIAIYPKLPIDRSDVPIREDQRMLNGQLRSAYRGTKKRIRYVSKRLTEAERASWASAHPWNTSYTHVDELGASRTVVTMVFDDPLEKTIPAVNGDLNTTGPAYYRVTVEVEEV